MSEEHPLTSNMSPNQSPDDDLSVLLRRTYDCEPPREEFVTSLAERLEAEFDPSSESATIDRLSQDQAAASTPESRRGSWRRRSWRQQGRSIAALAVAGVVVLAATIWTSQPSYSWTSMLLALETQPWVESALDTQDTGQDSELGIHGWFSQPHRLIVVRTGGDVLWSDWNDGLQSRYQSGSGVLLRDRLDGDGPQSVEESLLSVLRSRIGFNPVTREINSEVDLRSKRTANITVLSESWRTVGAGENQQIELDVMLSVGDAGAAPLHLLVTLDPLTHLPRSCQLIEDGGLIASTVRFAYPEQGPQEVFDVGVPRDVIVQDITSSGPAVRVASIDRVNELGSETPSPLNETPLNETLLNEVPIGPEETTPAIESAIVEADVAEFPQVQPPALVVASSEEMSLRVDDLMAACWDKNGVTPVAHSSDEEFFRRVSLDLTGRIPTVSECRAFTAEAEAGQRHRLVEQLLSRRDHATHLGAVWRKILLPDGVDLTAYGGAGSFEEWLSDRFRDNVPYDEIVRQLLLAEGRVSESGPLLFYSALNLKPEEIAAQTSRAFLGIRLECAQCHDHFFDKRLKQTDFWGLAAFFAQISQPEGKMDRVSPVLRIADTDHGEVTLPDSDDIVGPRYLLEKSLNESLDGSLDEAADAPSRRQQLAAWMTAAENPHFARATVNRVWAHLFGRGLVEPVDDMRIDNPSLCPEVLDELAGYFVATDFDLQDLFRVIVNSQTYQLTSRANDDDPARALHFAQMNIKSFTAEQLYDSISVATRLEPLESEDGSLMRVANIGRQSFLEQFRAPPGQVTDYQAGIPQALTLMNGGLIKTATGMRSSGILKSLEAPFFTDEQRVDTLFLATFSRQPDDTERQEMLDYVLADEVLADEVLADEEQGSEGQEDESSRQQRLGDVLWVLLNSAEFTLNH